ncbi:(Fe-S)-binding protein [Cytophagaceae bacterium AH-315-L13]|nr:(Fe-S)-binding protein [Cytophagaceae bacterium AH-315-L13]
MVIDIFIPCFVDQIYPNTGMNMVKVLEKLGCIVNYNTEQTCCGQPAFNSGFWDEATEVGKKFINDFSNERYIVSPSASCVGMVRNCYSEMFNNTSIHNEFKQIQKSIYEFSEFLTDVLKVDDVGAELNAVATYHDSCSALRECKIKEGPRKLLENVKGLEIKEMNDVETCCGFGGTFAVKYEPISVGMVQQKVDNIIATEAELIISTDLSCLMHIDGYIKHNNYPLKTMHIVDVLASGY